MAASDKISLSRLRELLFFESKKGRFIWINNRYGGAKAGSVAGNTRKDGYRRIILDGKPYYEHCLVWFYVYGKWPNEELDHINRIKSDNKITNLREATTSQNLQNRISPQPNTMSGLLGVSWQQQTKKWVASIRVNHTYHHIGSFDNKYTAHHAYLIEKERLHSFAPLKEMS